MVVRSAGDEIKAVFEKLRRKSLGVLTDLLLICLEFRLEGFAERNGLGGDDVPKRPPARRENRTVYLFCDGLSLLSSRPPLTAHRFMRRRRTISAYGNRATDARPLATSPAYARYRPYR